MRRLAIAGLVILTAAACDSTTPELEVPGIYRLVSVNGQPLPYAMPFEDAYGVEYERDLTAGRIVLSEDGGYYEMQERTYADGAIELDHRGEYLTEPNGRGVYVTFNRNGFGPVCEGAELTHGGLTCEWPEIGTARFTR